MTISSLHIPSISLSPPMSICASSLALGKTIFCPMCTFVFIYIWKVKQLTWARFLFCFCLSGFFPVCKTLHFDCESQNLFLPKSFFPSWSIMATFPDLASPTYCAEVGGSASQADTKATPGRLTTSTKMSISPRCWIFIRRGWILFF